MEPYMKEISTSVNTKVSRVTTFIDDNRAKKTKEANESEGFILRLPPEIMEVILQKGDLVDYHRFSAVCKTWNDIAVAAKLKHHFSLPQLPWVMLSSAPYPVDDRHSFFSLNHGNVIKLKLPEVRGCRCFGSSWGWLLMSNEYGDNFVLHPFSRLQIHLPSQTKLPGARLRGLNGNLEHQFQGRSFFRKAILLKPPTISSDAYAAASWDGVSSTAANCTVVAIYGFRKLCFSRPGSRVWTKILGTQRGERLCFEDVIVFNNQLYAVTVDYDLMLIELERRPKRTLVRMVVPEEHDQMPHELIYLVESCGELLMVVRHRVFPTGFDLPNRPHNITTSFKVFKLDSSVWSWNEVEDLGDQMLFIGTSGGFSLSASLFSGFRGNCIYFTDETMWYVYSLYDGPRNSRDLGMFRLEDGTIKSLFTSHFHSPNSPPVWFMPIQQ